MDCSYTFTNKFWNEYKFYGGIRKNIRMCVNYFVFGAKALYQFMDFFVIFADVPYIPLFYKVSYKKCRLTNII